MAELSGPTQIFHSNTDIVDTSQIGQLGKRGMGPTGDEYIYLRGVGSTAAGNWVVFDESYFTTRIVPDEVGLVGIAMAAINATTSFGWYQIYGLNTVSTTETIASADTALFIGATAGLADDLGVVGDVIVGAYAMTASSSGVTTVSIAYPSVSNELGGTGGASFSDNETPSGDVDGDNTVFTVTDAPSPAASLQLTLDGQILAAAGEDYTLSSTTITFNEAPLTDAILRAWYRF